MALINCYFRVRFTESERGYGQRSWYNYYQTKEEALASIERCNKDNYDDYARTGLVPDSYIQCEDNYDIVDHKD
jgi:hypothetical protein